MDESLFQRKGSIPFLLRNTVICAVSLFFWAALILLGSYFSTLLGITAALLGGAGGADDYRSHNGAALHHVTSLHHDTIGCIEKQLIQSVLC